MSRSAGRRKSSVCVSGLKEGQLEEMLDFQEMDRPVGSSGVDERGRLKWRDVFEDEWDRCDESELDPEEDVYTKIMGQLGRGD